jgi:acyl carrier protein
VRPYWADLRRCFAFCKGGITVPEPIPENIDLDVTQLIADVIGRSAQELKPEANFWNDLGVDSIKAIEITVAIEKRYRISVRDEQIPMITNVKQAIELVKLALEKKNAK